LAQSLSVTQAARQAAAPSHLYAPHDWLPAPHVPAPLHVPASVSVDIDVVVVGHDAAEHVVPFGHFSQPAAPSHFPSRPQVAASDGAQNVAGAGVPAATAAHVPVPVTLQALHAAQAPTSQQTPSVQLPLPHWPRSVHVLPRASLGVQVPTGIIVQKYPLAQSPLPAHVVRQAVVPLHA
jgi:hypothetical protein